MMYGFGCAGTHFWRLALGEWLSREMHGYRNVKFVRHPARPGQFAWYVVTWDEPAITSPETA